MQKNCECNGKSGSNGQMVVSKKNKIILIVVAVLLVAIIVTLSTLLGLSLTSNGTWLKNAENSFEQALYDFTENVFNIETNLSKMQVIRSANLQQEVLLNTTLEAQQANASLTHLSYKGYDLTSLTKFVNQCGDYCQQLLKKIDLGDKMQDSDYKNMSDMHDSFMNLGYQLTQIRQRVSEGSGKYIKSLGKLSSEFTSGLGEIINNSKYPSLIYDGAFSDSLFDKEPKGLPENEITQEAALEIARTYLSDYELKEINFSGVSATKIVSYMYSFVTKDNEQGTIQITKRGGLAEMWNISHEVTDPTFSEEEALEIAKQYAEKNNLQANAEVWTSVSGSVLFVNLCCKDGDVIIYPDMIKLKVSLQSGKVIGFEGLNYIYNHTQRTIETPTITMEQIDSMDFGGLEVISKKLCIIPMEDGTERLAYEIFGHIGNIEFFIYVDGKSGFQVRVLQVIDSDEGKLTV